MDLCWEGAVVQTCPPLKMSTAGLKPKALSERKSGLEVWRTRSQMTFFTSVWAIVVTDPRCESKIDCFVADVDLCWQGAVVQTSPLFKINGAGLKPKALSERKSGLEVWRTMFQDAFLEYVLEL